MRRWLPLLLFFALATAPAAALGQADRDPASPDLRAEAEALKSVLAEAMERYRAGEHRHGKALVSDAFYSFEQGALDSALAAKENALYRRLESEWLDLNARMKAQAPLAEVEDTYRRTIALLEQGAQAVSGSGTGAGTFLKAFTIILREGFEAILVLGAIVAYLTRIGARRRVPILWWGAGIAVLASLVLFALSEVLLDLQGPGQEALEGVTMLVAVVVLFWTSHWLISRADGRRWLQFIRGKVERALSARRVGLLGLLAFVVVFREGFETVLFYQALAISTPEAAGKGMIAAGFGVGAASLAGIYFAIHRLGVRIPIRAFFTVTGSLLYLLAFKFAGDGVRELQEAGWVSTTWAGFMPDREWLRTWLGIHPTVETAIAQGVLLAGVVGGWLWILLRRSEVAVEGAGAAATTAARETGRTHAVQLALLAVLLGVGVLWPILAASRDGRERPATPPEYRELRNPFDTSPDAVREGGRLFAANCAPCHGAGGRGDGVAAVGLDPRPADLATRVPELGDGDLFYVLANGKHGTAMPSFGAALSAEEKWKVIAHVRRLGN